MSTVLKNVQSHTAVLVIRHHKNQLMGGGGASALNIVIYSKLNKCQSETDQCGSKRDESSFKEPQTAQSCRKF